MKITLHGSCHCQAVRFRCELDAENPTSRCNCSICLKTRLWKTGPLSSTSFLLLQGMDTLSEYRYGRKKIAHMFCRVCGMKIFGHGGADVFQEEFYVVNMATIDDLSDAQRAALPVVFQDGRHDAYDSQPHHASFL